MTSNTRSKIFTVLLIIFIAAVSAALIATLPGKRQADATESASGQNNLPPSVFKEFSQPIYLPPLTISFLTKTLNIEEVGVEEDGRLGVPTGWQSAGWYIKGAKVGEEGNLIIDGHYDTNTGAPAAFWELKDLQVGDKVTLTDKTGKGFVYLVDGKSYISIKDPQRSQVFGSTKDKVLTLITCGGVWDYASGTYDKRLVITAKFDKMEKSW